MKSIVIVLLLCSMSVAGNPDERHSVEISIGGSLLKGDNSIFDDYGASVGQDGEQRSFIIGLEAISPASENVSVIASLDYLKIVSELDPTALFYEQEQTFSGVVVSIGLKIYFSSR